MLPDTIAQRIFTRETIQNKLVDWQSKGKKVVFTNGCFDILHRGHVTYLSQAKELGDILVVGLNTDSSVKRLGKAPTRPLQDEDARAVVMAGLRSVDAVILFDEDTPLELIRVVQPDVLVKGGDYTIETIVGHDVVAAQGGHTVVIPLVVIPFMLLAVIYLS